jgi:hypothetical protein
MSKEIKNGSVIKLENICGNRLTSVSATLTDTTEIRLCCGKNLFGYDIKNKTEENNYGMTEEGYIVTQLNRIFYNQEPLHKLWLEPNKTYTFS